MLARSIGSDAQDGTQDSPLPAELEFYESYDWSLNPYLTVKDAIRHLGEEIDKLSIVPAAWQFEEVATNIFLLSCGLLNCIDGYLRGPALNLPGRAASSVAGRGANRIVETILDKPWSKRRIARWREHLLADFNAFLLQLVAGQPLDAKRLSALADRLKIHLQVTLPPVLLLKQLSPPAPFSHLDLTPNDVLNLGDGFVRRFPERAQPILLVGLRTSGSYFAPLLRALLESNGYRSVDILTIDPNKGAARHEASDLKKFAARGYFAVIVDDPPETSRTLLAALDIVQRAGFAPAAVKFLAPTHPANPAWLDALPGDAVITLSPEQWHKRQLLDPKAVELRLADYLRGGNFPRIAVAAARSPEDLDARLQSRTSDIRGERLKRVFEVQLETPAGETRTTYVLAKSVGWGWLGYRAFLAGHRLKGYVPPVLGLRDGILYMEWIPQPTVEPNGKRSELIGASASYVAARARRLKLGDAATSIDLKRHDNAAQILAKALSRAYGRLPNSLLMRPRINKLLQQHRCPSPTFIDGNMHPSEWIFGPRGPLKTDYEHHGMGKTALNVVDPAYDLADTILNLALSPEEENKLIRQYVAESEDADVEQRLFAYKMLSGLWTMNLAQERLFDSPRGGDAQRDYHKRFMNAWNFLTVQTARYCGERCQPRSNPRWHAPLIALDIDGVLDRRLFGFPCTTAAGIKALSLLNAHDCSVALNTARSAAEVRDYCDAYALAGGVAEYGGYLWDAVNRREQILISAETALQLEQLRQRLRDIPGVFLDERHQYSIRAFTYRGKQRGLIQALVGSARASSVGDGALAPISAHIVHQLLVDLRLDRLAFHHTMIDTTIVAKEVDKGTGLVALRDWVLEKNAETIAVGDSEPDLAMFRVATRSFAPAHVGSRRQARLLGCQIVRYPYQQGLLDIVGKIIHPDGQRCELCARVDATPLSNDVVLAALQAADQSWGTNLGGALREPAAYKIFLQ